MANVSLTSLFIAIAYISLHRERLKIERKKATLELFIFRTLELFIFRTLELYKKSNFRNN
jgi:hypothetical protein